MARLTAAARDALPSSDFALPKTREYPIEDRSHAQAALREMHHATTAQQAQIRAAVKRHFPDIKVRTHDGTS